MGRATVELGFYWGQGGGSKCKPRFSVRIPVLSLHCGCLLGFCIDTGPYGEDSKAQTYISECV